MPTWPFAFTGFLYLDKIVAEFHRIPAVIQKFFKQLICRAVIVTVSQIFQDVAAQKAPLILIQIPVSYTHLDVYKRQIFNFPLTG